MKKYLILLLTALTFSLVSCEKDTEPGGTSVEKMAGDWWVTAHMMENGVDAGDVGVGHFRMQTFNTAANTSTEMWLEDGAHFWDYKLKVGVNYANRTFSTSDFVDNVAYESKVKITEGKVLKNAAKTPSGMPADSIVYFIQFDDDEDELIYKVSGFRRTGFPGDDF